MYAPREIVNLEEQISQSKYSFILVHSLFIVLWAISFLSGFSIGACIFALVLLYYILGQAIRKGVLEQLQSSTLTESNSEKLLIDILLGLIGSTTLVTILARLHLINHQVTPILLISIIAVLDGIALIRINGKPSFAYLQENDSLFINRDFMLSIILLLSIGAVFVFLRFIKFEWPYLAGTDTFSHLAAIQQILYDGGTSNIPGSYSYSFHSIAAAFCVLSVCSPHWLMSTMYLVVYPFSLIISFILLTMVTKNVSVSFIAMCVSMTVYEHGGLLATYYPYPSTFAYVFLYMIYIGFYVVKPSRLGLGLLLFAYLLVATSYPGAIIASLPIMAYLLSKGGFLSPDFSNLSKYVFIGFLSLESILILIYNVLGPLIGSNMPTITLLPGVLLTSTWDSAYLHFSLAYSITSAVALTMGILLAISVSKKPQFFEELGIDNEGLVFASLVSATFLGFFFAPIQDSFRTEMFVRPFFSTMIVVFLFIIMYAATHNPLKLRLPDFGKRIGRRRKSIIVIALTAILLVPISFEKLNVQATYLQFGEPQNPHPDEYDLLLWLENHTIPGSYILTDMSSGFYLRGLIFRNASTSFMIDGIAVSPYNYPNLTNRVFDFLNSTIENVNITYYNLMQDPTIVQYTNSIQYILVSPRTNTWISRARNDVFSRYAPYRYEMDIDDPAWTKFSDGIFRLVAQKGDARILEILL